MVKTLSCRELESSDCDEVLRGETEGEVMMKAAQHAQEKHGLTVDQLMDPQMMERVRGLIRDA